MRRETLMVISIIAAVMLVLGAGVSTEEYLKVGSITQLSGVCVNAK